MLARVNERPSGLLKIRTSDNRPSFGQAGNEYRQSLALKRWHRECSAMRSMSSLFQLAILVFSLFTIAGCAAPRTLEGNARPDAAVSAAPENDGLTLITQYGCANCHDPGDGSLAGQSSALRNTETFGTNLTPDPDTGLGDWSDEAIARALREGVDSDDQPLCPSMPRYPQITEPAMTTLIDYLRSLPPVRNATPDSICPPLKPGDAMDAGVPVDASPALADLDTHANIDLRQTTVSAGGVADMAVRDCHLLINEVATGTLIDPRDEFVEVINPCTADIDMSGVVLVYRSASGSIDHSLVYFTGRLAHGARLVCGGPHYSGRADAWYFATSLAESAGGLALVDATGSQIDSVGWGKASNAFVRTSPAHAPPRSQSLGRLPDGADTNDNARDFSVTRMPTPGMPNL